MNLGWLNPSIRQQVSANASVFLKWEMHVLASSSRLYHELRGNVNPLLSEYEDELDGAFSVDSFPGHGCLGLGTAGGHKLDLEVDGAAFSFFQRCRCHRERTTGEEGKTFLPFQ